MHLISANQKCNPAPIRIHRLELPPDHQLWDRTAPVLDLAAIEEKITAVEAEVEDLGTKLKGKKAELKDLAKEKLAAEKEAAEKKAEANKAAILEAVEKSGKTVEEILELLK